MILELSSGQTIPNPTDDQLRTALQQLNVERDGEGFAVFSRDKMTYLQVSGDATARFDMEYQAASTRNHFRAEREDFTLDEVVRAMARYRDGTIDWFDYGPWARITW